MDHDRAEVIVKLNALSASPKGNTKSYYLVSMHFRYSLKQTRGILRQMSNMKA